MYVFVNLLEFPGIIIKAGSNIMIIALNCVANKLIIFR